MKSLRKTIIAVFVCVLLMSGLMLTALATVTDSSNASSESSSSKVSSTSSSSGSSSSKESSSSSKASSSSKTANSSSDDEDKTTGNGSKVITYSSKAATSSYLQDGDDESGASDGDWGDDVSAKEEALVSGDSTSSGAEATKDIFSVKSWILKRIWIPIALMLLSGGALIFVNYKYNKEYKPMDPEAKEKAAKKARANKKGNNNKGNNRRPRV